MRKYKRSYDWLNIEKTEPKHLCANENCTEEGLYPAPVSRYSQKKYQYFCLEHIKEFNKSWNYFEGMDDAQFAHEIERMQLGGETWPMGLRYAAEKFIIMGSAYETHSIYLSVVQMTSKPKCDRPFGPM